MNDPVVFFAHIHEKFRGQTIPAAFHTGGDLNFSDLYLRSCALAHELSGSRLPVMIRGHKSVQILVAIWACMLSARPYVPIEPEFPQQRVEEIASACGASLVLHALPCEPLDLSNLETRDIYNFSDEKDGFVACPRSPRDTAYILFSSGTTGKPKGIRVTYQNVKCFAEWLDRDIFPDKPSQAITGNVRYCFDVSLFELWHSWTSLTPISIMDNSDFYNSRFSIARFAEHNVGIWVSTPSALQIYLRDAKFSSEELPDLKCFLFCGEVLPKSTVLDLFSRFPGARVVNTYGPTECTVAVSAAEISQADLEANSALPIGKPRPGCTLGLEEGQIVIQGEDVVGTGYVGLPEKTKAAFPRSATYLTGDMGYLGDQGNWYFSGRADREIKIQGVRIDLNEVEVTIRDLRGIETAHVAPHIVKTRIRAMNAYVCGPKSTQDLHDAVSEMAKKLPPWMVPRFWYACDEFPVNQNSKLDRLDLVRNAEVKGLRYVFR